LHAACEKGHADVVEFLLRHDADVDARDEDGNCPLHTATENQQTQVVQLLLDSGNQPDPENTVSRATMPGRGNRAWCKHESKCFKSDSAQRISFKFGIGVYNQICFEILILLRIGAP
jgi:ankyrin repeat protein